MLILIDNYDSFTYNLVHYLGELGAESVVIRNDKISAEEVLEMKPKAIVLSPGPCTPNEAGICLDLIKKAGPSIPLLGVCLGHQAIGQAYGGKVIRAPAPMHGKLSTITNTGKGVFKGLPKRFEVTRYHSLIVERATLARLPGDHGGNRRRPDHGPAAQDASRARRAVPSGKHRFAARPRAAWRISWRSPASRRKPARRLERRMTVANPARELKR